MLGHGASIVRNGLVLQLDAANTKSYPGSGIDWYNLTNTNSAATLTNGPVYSNNSFTFDGIDDVVIAPVSFSMSNATASLWINIDSAIWGTRFDIWASNIFANTNGRFLLYRDTATSIAVYNMFPSLTINSISIANANTLFSNTWKNLVVTGLTTGSSTTISVYIDGIFYSSSTIAEAVTATNSQVYLMRGWNNNNLINPTKGRLANFQIYNRALTAEEIQQNFNALRGRYGI